MKKLISLTFIGASSLLAACSDGNSYFDGLSQQSFDKFVIEVVSNDTQDSEPRTIENRMFLFTQDEAAFASLFPAE